jgi:hypothetical protein
MENPATSGASGDRLCRIDAWKHTPPRHENQHKQAAGAICAGLTYLPDPLDLAEILRCRLDLPERIWLAFAAILSLPSDTAEDACEAVLADLRAGPIAVPFNDLRAEARDWAGWASRGELRAYFGACWNHLPAADRADFLRTIQSKAKAA